MKYSRLLIGLIASLPALAQDHSFKVGVDYGIMKTRINNPTILGTAQPFSGPGQFNLLAEYGDTNPLGIDLACRSGNDEFALEMLSFSDTKSVTYPSGAYFINAAAGNPFSTGVKLAATILDLKWNHYFPMKQAGTFATTLGARYGDFEDKVSSSGSSIAIVTDFKTTGFGLIGGVGYSYPFTGAFSVGADYDIILFRGSDKSTGFDTDATYYPAGTTAKKNSNYSQSDLRAHLDWKVTRALAASVGYRRLGFGQVATTGVPANNNFEFTSAMYQPANGWRTDGWTLGLSYTF
jgi:hypothetical protein